MSLISEELNKRFGSEIKIAGFYKKTSVMRQMISVEKNLKSYIDDRTKVDYPDAGDLDDLGNQDFIEALFNGEAALREGQDMSKCLEEDRVIAGGYLKAMLGSSSLGEEELDETIKIWEEKTRGSYKKATHMVFSLDPRIAAKYFEKGHSSHGMLLSSVTKTLSKYQEQFYPGRELGYVAGFHSDRHHPHVHVLMLPTLDNGQKFNLSHYTVKGDCRFDYQGYVKREFNRDSWSKYMEYVLLPEVEKRALKERESEVERIGARKIQTYLATDQIMSLSEADMDGTPRRDFLPHSKKRMLEDPDREEIFLNNQQVKYATFLDTLAGKIEKPDVDQAQATVIRHLEEYREVLQRGVEIAETKAERTKSAIMGIESAPEKDGDLTDEQLRDQWGDLIGRELPIVASLIESGSVFYTDAMMIDQDVMPEHLRPEHGNFDFPKSSSEIEEQLSGELNKCAQKCYLDMQVEPIEDLRNQILFTKKERSDCRKQVQFGVAKHERIARGLSAISKDYRASDHTLKGYEISRAVDFSSTRSKIEELDEVVPLPSKKEITLELDKKYSYEATEVPDSYTPDFDEL